MVNPHSKQLYPPAELKLESKTIYTGANNNQTIKAKSNNPPINSLTNRINPIQIPLDLPHKEK